MQALFPHIVCTNWKIEIPGNDLGDQTSLDTIRLDGNEGSLRVGSSSTMERGSLLSSSHRVGLVGVETGSSEQGSTTKGEVLLCHGLSIGCGVEAAGS